ILCGNYQYFEDTYFFKAHLLNEELEIKVHKKYISQLNELIEVSNDIDLRKKLSRLFVLNNSCLPKAKLKDKIGVFITVYTSIAEHTISQSNNSIYSPFQNFPKRWDFLDFTREIQNEIIEEMNLGYKKNIEDKNDFELVFKNRYNLK